MVKNSEFYLKHESTIKDDYSIVINSINGIGADVFFDLAEITGLKKNQLAEEILQISLKTLSRYRDEQKKMSPRNSEMILKLISLYKKGIEIFSSSASFNRWLKKSSIGLGNKLPYELMNTSTGIDLIYNELVRIEFGAFS